MFDEGQEALPVVGCVDIVLDWGGAPALATRTLEVLRVPRMLGRIDGMEYGESCLTIEPWSQPLAAAGRFGDRARRWADLVAQD